MNGPIDAPCPACRGTLVYFGPRDPLTPGDVDDRVLVQDQPPLPEKERLATVIACIDCAYVIDASDELDQESFISQETEDDDREHVSVTSTRLNLSAPEPIGGRGNTSA